MEGEIFYDVMGVSIVGAKAPNFACGDGTVENRIISFDPLVEGDHFDGELGEAFGEVGLFGFNDEEIIGAGDVVIEGAFEPVADGDGVFDVDGVVEAIADLIDEGKD